MDIKIIYNIKNEEIDHKLNILIFDFGSISPNAMYTLSEFANITIVNDSSFKNDILRGKLENGKNIRNIRFALVNQIPIDDYDILLSNSCSELTYKAISLMKIKYILFFNPNSSLNSTKYNKFEEGCFRLTENVNVSNIPEKAENTVIKEDININNKYKLLVDSLKFDDLKYSKYHLNYLHDMVPGKVSIIMIISKANTKFPNTLKALKAQNVANAEYIIIDNAAGFRNNVKPNIRYGEAMPYDFCAYHAKELCSGEYMIVLNQDSDEIDILSEINKGHCETR